MTRHVIGSDVTTTRGRVHARRTEAAADGSRPLVLVHGNCSSSAFFQRLLEELPHGVDGIAPDLRGFGETDPLPVDATRGLRDFSDDIAAFLDAVSIPEADFVAHSAGAGVVMQLAIDHPHRVGRMILEAPMSPYGFGGTVDVVGTPAWPDFAGSGGGTANPEFVQLIAAGDRSADKPASPRNVFRALYVAPEFSAPDEDLLVDSMLSTRIGDDYYPGPGVPSENWPGTAPGTTGVNNAISAKYCNLAAFADVRGPGPITWVRGARDAIVSDASMLDFGQLGAVGAVPGWPGPEVYPPQPMVSQMRALLDRWAGEERSYEEIVLDGVGHSPHLESPDRFREILLDALG